MTNIKGVLRDHRLPNDYKHPLVQPMHTKAFYQSAKRTLTTRMITKFHASLPIYLLFGFGLPFFAVQCAFKYYSTGSLPQCLQVRHYIYRKNLAYHGFQHGYNANPDNHYDRMSNAWTSDPMCGLDIGPKRPWEDLKDPTKNLVKFQRDATENQHVKANGWKGY